jgi:hypothetical protein
MTIKTIHKFAWSILLAAAGLYGGTAQATTLEVTVVGSDDTPKPIVRVEVRGPQSKKVFTDEQGRFTVELTEGVYTIEVFERNRRARKTGVNVPAQGKIDVTLKLDW